jgi:hypothetical protein
MPQFLTTRQVGEIIGRPEWLIRRVVDSLDTPVQRFGHKRMIPAAMVEVIRDEVERREHPELEAIATC